MPRVSFPAMLFFMAHKFFIFAFLFALSSELSAGSSKELLAQIKENIAVVRAKISKYKLEDPQLAPYFQQVDLTLEYLEQEERLPAFGVFGASRSGKSTLFHALAGTSLGESPSGDSAENTTLLMPSNLAEDAYWKYLLTHENQSFMSRFQRGAKLKLRRLESPEDLPYILLDLPGFDRSDSQEAFVQSLPYTDLAWVLVPESFRSEAFQGLLKKLKESQTPVVFVFNQYHRAYEAENAEATQQIKSELVKASGIELLDAFSLSYSYSSDNENTPQLLPLEAQASVQSTQKTVQDFLKKSFKKGGATERFRNQKLVQMSESLLEAVKHFKKIKAVVTKIDHLRQVDVEVNLKGLSEHPLVRVLDEEFEKTKPKKERVRGVFLRLLKIDKRFGRDQDTNKQIKIERAEERLEITDADNYIKRERERFLEVFDSIVREIEVLSQDDSLSPRLQEVLSKMISIENYSKALRAFVNRHAASAHVPSELRTQIAQYIHELKTGFPDVYLKLCDEDKRQVAMSIGMNAVLGYGLPALGTLALGFTAPGWGLAAIAGGSSIVLYKLLLSHRLAARFNLKNKKHLGESLLTLSKKHDFSFSTKNPEKDFTGALLSMHAEWRRLWFVQDMVTHYLKPLNDAVLNPMDYAKIAVPMAELGTLGVDCLKSLGKVSKK